MTLLEIASYIDSIAHNTSLYQEKEFDQRMEVIDFLGFQIVHGLDELQAAAAVLPQLRTLRNRVEQLKSDLESVDSRLFRQLRTTIRSTGCTGPAFKALVNEYVRLEQTRSEQTEEIGYDNLDILLKGLSPQQTMPQQTKDLEPEMVYFQKTPARIVFELVEKSHFVQEDVFFDLGAGLGQVAILVNLLAGIKAKGIEFEPAFCDYAQDCAATLHLSDVTFINEDARKADYSEGTVFFMFTPFRGEILQEVLEILRQESLSRKIKIITYGPCTTHVAQQDWLKPITPEDSNMYRLAVFSSL